MRVNNKIRRYIDDILDNDEVSMEEAAFMIGYYSDD